jgi:hypothetical protein
LLPLLNDIASYRSLDSARDLYGSAFFYLNKRRIPQRVQVFFPAVKTHVNAVAAAILSELHVKRLMDVPGQRRIVFLDARD